MSKKVAILVEKDFQDMEVMYPYFRLKEEGFDVFLIGTEKGKEYHGKYGYPVVSDISIKEALDIFKEFDCVIIPGGWAPDFMRRTPYFAEFVRKMNDSDKVIASICHGGWILSSADILKDKKVTSFFAIKDDLTNAGAKWVDEEVVVDGKLVTSRKPDDLPAFLKAIISLLK